MRYSLTVVCLALVTAFASPLEGQSPQETFQRALAMERSAGKLDSAIALYRLVVSSAGPNRALAARALIRLGSAYEVLGRTEARAAYQRVVREFGDQSELAAQARQRIAAMDIPSATAASALRTPVARQVWSGANVNFETVPSPERRHSAYFDWEKMVLTLRDLATGSDRAITKRPDGDGAATEDHFVFSPNGRQIAYAWWRDKAENGAGVYELRTIGVDGGEPRVVPTAPLRYVEPFQWTRAADGLLAAVSEAPGVDYLCIIRLSGEIQRVKSIDRRWVANASLSPDGRWIVYDAFPGTQSRQRDIHIIAVDGTRDAVLVGAPSNDWHPMWTPDESGVVFYSERSGARRAWKVDVNNGAAAGPPRVLTPDMGGTEPIGFTRDGAFWYGQGSGSADILTATIDSVSGELTGKPVELGDMPIGENSMPEWSPDGSTVALMSRRSASAGLPRALVLRSSSGAQREFVLELDYYTFPRWSPDGRTILVSGRSPHAGHGIFGVDVESGKLSTLRLLDGEWVPRGEWSPNSRSIYYLMLDRLGMYSLHRYDIAARADTTIYSGAAGERILNLAPSPNGMWLAFSVTDSRGPRATRLLSLRDGAVRDIEPARPYAMLNWLPDSRSLLAAYSATRTVTANMEYLRIPIDGGSPVRLELTTGFNNLRVDRSGRRIVFQTQPPSLVGRQLWVMENLLPPAPRAP